MIQYGYYKLLKRIPENVEYIEMYPAVFVFLKGQRMICLEIDRRYFRNRMRYKAWKMTKEYNGMPYTIWWNKL